MSKYKFEISRVIEDGEKLIALHLVGAPKDIMIAANDDTDTFPLEERKNREQEAVDWLISNAKANCERLYGSSDVEITVNL
ncbi:hypothetical protein QR721_06805 [Aciduricibacillus chroicocephali]|uniref:Uncharacterized protein n=1 Tax=Aciduricibacillus chroicocephali TaxID=3054939 RepID=A0ABY9KYU5_9BACI|nr:hypothetical protein QR721_06805 [Bacillaceae bacterium 44XB]